MRGVIKEIAVGTAGLLGAAVLAWLVLSTVLGWELIVFRTGSMAPTMPTGTAAIAVPVAATDVEVGDVLTIHRDGDTLPVTHRVVDVAAAPGVPEARAITMRGDANTIDDRDPYVVTDALRVVAAAPGAGTALVHARQPATMAVSTIALALIVTWGLWPARGTPPDASSTPEAAHA